MDTLIRTECGCGFSPENIYAGGGLLPDGLRLLPGMPSRITKEVKGINRVVYDIMSKPPKTINREKQPYSTFFFAAI